jgi:hypothetical protein
MTDQPASRSAKLRLDGPHVLHSFVNANNERQPITLRQSRGLLAAAAAAEREGHLREALEWSRQAAAVAGQVGHARIARDAQALLAVVQGRLRSGQED